MLQQRRESASNINHASNHGNSHNSNHLDNPNSAKSTAISCPSDQDLRVPCYCEENVWRLAYRRIFGPASTTSSTTTKSSSSSTGNATVDKENEQYYVVFISNDQKCCPMFNQKASKHPDEACFWDYHVILLQSSKLSSSPSSSNKKDALVTHVLDMDSRLSFPSSLEDYIQGTFEYVEKYHHHNQLKKKYAPKFRVIRAELFLQYFYSDRMHMYQNGKWSSPPPSYDCIMTTTMTTTTENVNNNSNRKFTSSKSNLSDFVNMMSAGKGEGKESSVMGEVLTLKELRSKFGGGE